MTNPNLKDVIAYIAKEYPNKSELSNARLTKMVYLADWHQAINHQKQITNIHWYYDSYGPYVPDIRNEVEKNPDMLSLKEGRNIFGNKKTLLELKNDSYEPNLIDEQKASIDHIIKVTKDKNWDEFIKLVYSTHPIMTSKRYSYLDLLEKAKEYKKESAD